MTVRPLRHGLYGLFTSLLGAGCANNGPPDHLRCTPQPPTLCPPKPTRQATVEVARDEAEVIQKGDRQACLATCLAPLNAAAKDEHGDLTVEGQRVRLPGVPYHQGVQCYARPAADAGVDTLVTIQCEAALDVTGCVPMGGHPCGRGHAHVQADLQGAGPTPAAAWLASATRAEAASVLAFEALRHELAAHGAPGGLRERAGQAANEERRHAAAMARLARDEGARPVQDGMSHVPAARPLLEFAIENAVEGCVRETFSALLALHQSQHAPRATMRRALSMIAVDEASHAELAWDIHAWALDQLSPADVARVEAALEAAAQELTQADFAARDGETEADRAAVGLPTRSRTQALAAALDAALWHAAA